METKAPKNGVQKMKKKQKWKPSKLTKFGAENPEGVLMKSHSLKIGFYAGAVLSLLIAATFSACGDSNTTEVTEPSGMEILAKGEKMPSCTKDNLGDMLYVSDSAAVFYCADCKWSSLDGKDGEPGKAGTATEGKSGSGCTAKTVENGIEVSCNGKVVGTVKNGESATAKNGDDGVGCSADDKGDGKVEVTCGEGEAAKTVTLYKAMCDAKSYDPETQYCLDLNGKKKVEALLIDDRDKENVQVYRTVTIEGSYEVVDKETQMQKTVEYREIWMAQNLNYPADSSWCGGGRGKQEGDCSQYGRVYTWAAAVGKSEDECGYQKKCALSGTIQGVCPDGWHLPSDGEWGALVAAIGGMSSAGTLLKSNNGWNSYMNVNVLVSGNGNDAFGFAVLPAGYRISTGSFSNVGIEAYFWSSSEQVSTISFRWVFSRYDDVKQDIDYKYRGFSVRCIKDSDQSASN